MGERRATIVLQWSEQWIRIDLVAGAIQVTASVIGAKVITEGRHCASVVDKIASQILRKDGVSESRYCVPHPEVIEVIDAVTQRRFSDILKERAVRNLDSCVADIVDTAPEVARVVGADGAVEHLHIGDAIITDVINRAAI